MLWQGRVTRASGDCPVRNRRVTPVAPPLLIHQRNPVRASSLAHILAGAEEAGMKGWRGRSRIPPEGAKARFTRVSRGLAPQVSFFSSPCHHQQHIHSSIYGGVRPSLSTMKQGYIAQTLPQKPKSPLQRYRLLRKGREVLA